MDYHFIHESDEQRAVTLWYASVPLTRLLADVDTIGHGLRGNAVMRVYSIQQEALTAVPALCAARGYVLLPFQEEEIREGDRRPRGRFHFDIMS